MQQDNNAKLNALMQQMIQNGEATPAEFSGPAAPAEETVQAQPVQQTISQLQNGSSFSGMLLVRSADIRTGKTGRPYMDLRLGDATGELVCKLWNVPDGAKAPAGGSVASVSGKVESYNGQLQLRADFVRETGSISEAQRMLLVPSAPESPESMRQEVENTIDSFASEDLRRLVREMLRMADEQGKLNMFPAAQRMHHAEYGGLLHHTTSMLKAADSLTDVYNSLYPGLLRKDLLLAGVIIHDLAKIEEMASDDFGVVSDYTADGLLVGHIVRGVCNLDRAARRVGVSGELVEMLEHMLLSHHGIPEYGSPRMPMFPEAEMLHILDLTDARMNELKGIEERTAPGTFSERINSLDGRRIYHPKYTMSRTEPEDN